MTPAQERYIFKRRDYLEFMKCYPLAVDDLDGEEWRDIEGFDGKYQVSNYGRVKSFKYNTPRILKPTLDPLNYLLFFLFQNRQTTKIRAHQLVAKAFIPNPKKKREVNHIDGCKINNYVGNLEWATRSENQQHAYDIGLQGAGAEHYKAKISTTDAIYIRENPDGLTGKELAEKFHMSETTIGRIQTGKIWKHLGGITRKANPRRYTPPISDEIKKTIRAEHKEGIRGYGYKALAKKFGYAYGTIRRIVNEK